MATVGLILASISGIGSLVCLIIVLTKLFPKEGVLLGIAGIICGLYTYIWGWINKNEFNLQQIMIAWTALIILGIIGNVMAQAGAASMGGGF